MIATAEARSRLHDRQNRKHPFTAWVKRLANLRNSPTGSMQGRNKKGPNGVTLEAGKATGVTNNPYPESGYLQQIRRPSSSGGHRSYSVSTGVSRVNSSYPSLAEDGDITRRPALMSNRSTAPTVATYPETINSDAEHSKTGTSHTAGGGISLATGAGNSIFSSPYHSDQSLTTTLTTMQSMAPSALLVNPPATAGAGALTANNGPSLSNIATVPHNATATQPNSSSNNNGNSLQPALTAIHFFNSHPTSPVALTPYGHAGGSYSSAAATALAGGSGNILTDNASILTLASSSKRRRRHSLDTNASVRAIAPSSLWGGSRESLPLSVLSSNIDAASTNTPGPVYQGSGRLSIVGGLASVERASVYSSSGVTAPLLSGDRSSSGFYATKLAPEGASIRSGLISHGRTNSVCGSIGGTSTAATPSLIMTGPPISTPTAVTTNATPSTPVSLASHSAVQDVDWVSRRNSANFDTAVERLSVEPPSQVGLQS